ncbi:hypothetical protein TB1_000552 [Malus domestica]
MVILCWLRIWRKPNEAASYHPLPMLQLHRRWLRLGSPANRHELGHLELPFLNFSFSVKLSATRRYVCMFSVSSSGNSSSLALFWSEEIPHLALPSYVHHIDAEIGMVDDVCHLRITGFYGFIATTERYKSWDLIQSLSTASSLPWLILGDFNKVILAFEKFGGRGDSFTWANLITKCRLDCCLISPDWRPPFNYLKCGKAHHRFVKSTNNFALKKRGSNGRIIHKWSPHNGLKSSLAPPIFVPVRKSKQLGLSY